MTNPELKVSEKVRELADKMCCWHWNTNRVSYPAGSPNERKLLEVSELIQSSLSELLEAGRESCEPDGDTAHFAAILSKWEVPK